MNSAPFSIPFLGDVGGMAGGAGDVVGAALRFMSNPDPGQAMAYIAILFAMITIASYAELLWMAVVPRRIKGGR